MGARRWPSVDETRRREVAVSQSGGGERCGGGGLTARSLHLCVTGGAKGWRGRGRAGEAEVWTEG